MSAGCKILIPRCVVSGIARDLEVNYPLSLVAGNSGRKLVVGVHCKCAFTTKDIFQFSTFRHKRATPARFERGDKDHYRHHYSGRSEQGSKADKEWSVGISRIIATILRPISEALKAHVHWKFKILRANADTCLESTFYDRIEMHVRSGFCRNWTLVSTANATLVYTRTLMSQHVVNHWNRAAHQMTFIINLLIL